MILSLSKPTIILSNFRSGSHHLLALLQANGYRIHGEIIPRLSTDIRRENRREYRLDQGATLKKYLSESFKSRYHSNSAGILHKMQIDSVIDLTAESFYNTFGVVNYIHLTREALDCAVSFFIARQDGHFFMRPEIKPRHEPVYDYEKLMEVYTRYTTVMVWPEKLLADLNAIPVSYADLVSSPEATMAQLGIALVGSPFPVYTQTRFAKQDNPLKPLFKKKFLEDRNA